MALTSSPTGRSGGAVQFARRGRRRRIRDDHARLPALSRTYRLVRRVASRSGHSFFRRTAHDPLPYSDSTETIVTDPSPVAYLRVGAAHHEPKAGHRVPDPAELREMLRVDDSEAVGMALWDEVSRGLLEDGDDEEEEGRGCGLPAAREAEAEADMAAPHSRADDEGKTKTRTVVQFSKVQESFAVSIYVLHGACLAFEDEVERVFQQLEGISLSDHRLPRPR